MSKICRILFITFLVLLSTQSIFAGRYYDSATGRWLSVDPLTHKSPGVSPYVYALNNPLANIDPDGKEPITLTATGVVAAGAVTIALAGHSYNYLTNPSYRRSYDSFVNSSINVAKDAVNDVVDGVISLFSSDEGTTSDGGESIDWENSPPATPDDLGDEWQEITSDKNKSGNHREFENTKTGEKVRFDKGKEGTKGNAGKDHWHRNNPNSTGKTDRYLDKSGNPVPKGSPDSHILP
ncbi:MAG: RHS repeat-associated core domain-containing protein [Ignavibacteria bacterium]|jgi:uncharacterized protein RhaS with RHS repeats